MKYSVYWSPKAEQRLATLWNNAPNRQAVADAANAIDQALPHNPHYLGESRTPETRIFFWPPLGILYTILEQDHFVKVLDVWRYGKRRQKP